MKMSVAEYLKSKQEPAKEKIERLRDYAEKCLEGGDDAPVMIQTTDSGLSTFAGGYLFAGIDKMSHIAHAGGVEIRNPEGVVMWFRRSLGEARWTLRQIKKQSSVSMTYLIKMGFKQA